MEVESHTPWRPRNIEHEGEAESRRVYNILAILAPVLLVVGAIVWNLQKES